MRRAAKRKSLWDFRLLLALKTKVPEETFVFRVIYSKIIEPVENEFRQALMFVLKYSHK